MSELDKCEKYLDRVRELIELDLPWEKIVDKTVVISGATGMVGKMLIDVLIERCKVVAIGRNEKKARERLGKYFDQTNFEFIEADVGSEVPKLKQADYILHLASATHPKQYATEPIGTITANVLGLKSLLDIAVKLKTERFLFASSVEIYGENRGDVKEFDEKYMGYIDCNTLRAGYPESKRVGEALCQAYGAQHNLSFTIARLARVFGPTMLMNDTKASSQFIKNALNNEDIILKSKGEQEYSYLYVADAVKGILYVLLCGESGEAYNVADEKFNVKLKDFAEVCAKIVGRKVIYDLPSEVEAKGFSKATKALMNSRKIQGLGFKVKGEFSDAVQETIEICRSLIYQKQDYHKKDN